MGLRPPQYRLRRVALLVGIAALACACLAPFVRSDYLFMPWPYVILLPPLGVIAGCLLFLDRDDRPEGP